MKEVWVNVKDESTNKSIQNFLINCGIHWSGAPNTVYSLSSLYGENTHIGVKAGYKYMILNNRVIPSDGAKVVSPAKFIEFVQNYIIRRD